MPVTARRMSVKRQMLKSGNFSPGGSFPDSGERAYAYAKACGIIGKSFLGKKVSALRDIRSPGELDQLLFSETRRSSERHERAGKELLPELEKRIEKRAVDHILSIVNSFSNPPDLFIRQLRVYEYSDLKACLHHIAGNIAVLPSLSNIGRFRTIQFEAFPDLAAMLQGTEFQFILSKDLKALQPDSSAFALIETELDACYYLGLAESLRQLSHDDHAAAQQILATEISLRNCNWALRLRSYFRKTAAETRGYLMNINMSNPAKNLASDALESLDLPLDSRAPWQGWKWKKFLNPEKPGEYWSVNPRYFQNAASQYLHRLAWRCFHGMPMAISTIFSYIKLKQFEEDILTSVAEGLSMGMSSADVFDLLEAQV